MEDSGCPFRSKSSKRDVVGGSYPRLSNDQVSPEYSPKASPNDFHWRNLLIKPILGKEETPKNRNIVDDNGADGCCSSLINKENMMPVLSNIPTDPTHQMLSTQRQISTIPKTGAPQSFWLYPSSLQFFKAMELKHNDPDHESMDEVVHVHNWVNEECWKKILEWEKMHEKRCKSSPTLTRFVGRYNDLTIKARWNTYFTHLGRPFDRHDWFVNRCGITVRYVIDYYDDPTKNDNMQVTLDVRPALDSLSAIYDRMRLPVWRVWSGRSSLSP